MTTYDELVYNIKHCVGCKLSETRTNAVPGEGPGRDEDLSGRPFVGAAGQLLDKILTAVDIPRESVYIANIVKCRPPNNRNPKDDEAETCLPYLRHQVAMIHPRMIVCLGSVAAKHIIDKNVKISKVRGEFFSRAGYDIMPTYHPAALLHNPALKKAAWEDFKKIKKRLSEYEKENRD